MFFELNNIVTITQLVVTSQFQLFETKQSIPENLDVLILRPQRIPKSTLGLRQLFTIQRHILEHQ